jgi:hypothetical protein
VNRNENGIGMVGGTYAREALSFEIGGESPCESLGFTGSIVCGWFV